MAFHRSIVLALALALPTTFGLSSGCNEENILGQDEFAEESARVRCDLYFRCACSDFHEPDRYTSPEQCRGAVASQTQRAIDEGVAAGLTYDGRCTTQTLETYEDVGCRTSIPLSDLVDVDQATKCKLYHGEGGAGSACTSLQESNGDDCEKVLRCENNVCVPIDFTPGPGDSCAIQFQPCTEGALCLDLDEDGESRCEPTPGVGETCLGQVDICDEGLTCDQSTKTCTTAPGDGETCSMALWPLNKCAEGTVCDSDDTCKALPEGGEDCVADRCAEGFTCNAGVCVEAAPLICAFV